jgi:hypothetical protein
VSDLVVAQSGSIKAVYTGDAANAPSTSASHTATVAKEHTTTTLTPQFANVATNVADTLTAQVTFTGSNAIPTGSVTFWSGAIGTGTNLGTATLTPTVVNVSGTTPTLEALATLTGTTFTTTGSKSLFAVYSGDSNFTGGTVNDTNGSASVNVTVTPTVVVTTSNTNPGNSSASVTETVTVSGSGGTPTGYVQFYDNLVPIGSAVLLSSGTATVSLTTSATQGTDGSGNQFLLPGMQSITAVYSGDSTYSSATGVYQQAVQANTFGAGDKFVQRIGDGINSLDAPTGSTVAGAIGSTIYVDEINPGTGNTVQSIILPTNDGVQVTTAGSNNYDQRAIHAIVGNGQQSTTEQMTVDGANTALWLTGYDVNPLLGAAVSSSGVTSGQGTLAPGIETVTGSNSQIRSVARITTAGAVADVTMTATNSGSNFGNFNAVYSRDGTSFYVAGNGGVKYYATFAPASGQVSPTATINTSSQTGTATALEPEGNNLALVGPTSTFGVDGPQVFSGFPTASQTSTQLPGFSDSTATTGGQTTTFFFDAYFTHLDNTAGTGGSSTAPAGINTMYLSDDGTNFARGAITKWSLVSGSWVVTDHIQAGGTAPNPISYYYISGQTLSEGPGSSSVGNVTLYVTYGNGGNADTGPGQLMSITDNSGYAGTGGLSSTTNNPSGGTIITQTSSSSKEVYRGVAGFTTTDLTGTATGPSSLVEGTAASNVQVATFSDPADASGVDPVGNFSATIAWGDNSTSAGTITQTSSAAPTGVSATAASGGSLTDGTTYYYMVSAVISGVESAASAQFSSGAISGTNQTNDLTWTAVSGASSYNVYRTTTSGSFSATSLLASPTTNSFNDDGTGTLSAGAPPATNYKVTGTHTYAEDTASSSSYAITVTVSDSSQGANLILTTSATVADAGSSFNDIAVTGTTMPTNLMEATSFTTQVASFTDPIDFGGHPDAASNYTATIDWGDGSTSTGTITLTNSTAVWPNSGIYNVSGTHTYAEDSVTPYTIKVTVSNTENGSSSDDQNASGTTTATVMDCGGPNDITVTGTAVTGVEGSSTGSVQVASRWRRSPIRTPTAARRMQPARSR